MKQPSLVKKKCIVVDDKGEISGNRAETDSIAAKNAERVWVTHLLHHDDKVYACDTLGRLTVMDLSYHIVSQPKV